MYPSTSTLSRPTTSITTLSIVPYTSPYITQYDLENAVKYIHTDIKSFNNNITALFTELLDTNYKQDAKLDKQDKKITELSSKLSTYEDLLEEISINKTQLQTLKLQVK